MPVTSTLERIIDKMISSEVTEMSESFVHVPKEIIVELFLCYLEYVDQKPYERILVMLDRYANRESSIPIRVDDALHLWNVAAPIITERHIPSHTLLNEALVKILRK